MHPTLSQSPGVHHTAKSKSSQNRKLCLPLVPSKGTKEIILVRGEHVYHERTDFKYKMFKVFMIEQHGLIRHSVQQHQREKESNRKTFHKNLK